MEWIRCNICNDLKQEIDYYKDGEDRRKACKKCMKEKYFLDKESKKEYDKKRYEKNKLSRKNERNICMRCGKYFINVRNNQLEWCFHCLFFYEKQWKQKIKVEVVSSAIRKVRSDYVWNSGE